MKEYSHSERRILRMPDNPASIDKMLKHERLFLWKRVEQSILPDAPEEERIEIVLERSMQIPHYSKLTELESRIRRLENESPPAAPSSRRKQQSVSGKNPEIQHQLDELMQLHISIIEEVFYEKTYYSELFPDEPHYPSI